MPRALTPTLSPLLTLCGRCSDFSAGEEMDLGSSEVFLSGRVILFTSDTS